MSRNFEELLFLLFFYLSQNNFFVPCFSSYWNCCFCFTSCVVCVFVSIFSLSFVSVYLVRDFDFEETLFFFYSVGEVSAPKWKAILKNKPEAWKKDTTKKSEFLFLVYLLNRSWICTCRVCVDWRKKQRKKNQKVTNENELYSIVWVIFVFVRTKWVLYFCV